MMRPNLQTVLVCRLIHERWAQSVFLSAARPLWCDETDLRCVIVTNSQRVERTRPVWWSEPQREFSVRSASVWVIIQFIRSQGLKFILCQTDWVRNDVCSTEQMFEWIVKISVLDLHNVPIVDTGTTVMHLYFHLLMVNHVSVPVRSCLRWNRPLLWCRSHQLFN